MTARLSAPAAERNRQPILEVLQRVVPAGAFVLEVGCGTGQHAAWAAARLDRVRWQPTDADPHAIESADAWRTSEGIDAMLPAILFDALTERWPCERADVVVCINVIHISAWEVCEALMRGAGSLLPPGGLLYTYGPYKRDGVHTAPSNERFDRSLRTRDRSWGVRDVADVAGAAAAHELSLEEIVEMPANNLSLIFRKAGLAHGGEDDTAP